MFINEKCWFIVGYKIGNFYIGKLKYHSEGSPGYVHFDWSKAIGVIGFFHSHPSDLTGPSSRDNRTMKAWVISEGKALICGIFCDGNHRSFLYDKKGYTELRSTLIGSIFIGRER